MKLFLNFEISSNTSWHSKIFYDNPPSAAEIAKAIDTIQIKMKNYLASNCTDSSVASYASDCQFEYLLMYIYEALSGENNIPGDCSQQDVERFLTCTSGEKNAVKARNMKEAVDELFPNIYDTTSNLFDLTPATITHIHSVVMKQLLTTPGEFRTKAAAPSLAGTYIYMDVAYIKEELTELCHHTTYHLFRAKTFAEHVKIGASFFVNFLRIHPFENGNGRVARLLLSLLLRKVTVVPVLFYKSKDQRSCYLHCLEEARNGNYSTAANMSRFILGHVYNSNNLISFMLELDN